MTHLANLSVMDALNSIESEIASTQSHIDHQRHIIQILHEHGHSQDVPTAEVLLETLTISLDVLCEKKENLLTHFQQSQPRHSAKPRLLWISK
jgi:hypothetical protein